MVLLIRRKMCQSLLMVGPILGAGKGRVHLVVAKVVVAYFRDHSRRDAMVKQFADRGLVGLADALKHISVPNFANWRWQTLHRCCTPVHAIWESFSTHFSPECFGRLRDRSELAKLCACVASTVWPHQLEFIQWFTSVVDEILAWIGTCECHEEEILAGENIECHYRGRRVAQAYRFAVDKLKVALDECNLWTANRFGGDVGMLDACQGCTRYAYSLTLKKIEHLNCIPWLLARLEEPGVRAICQEQYQSRPPHLHHRVSHAFLSPDSELHGDVANIDDEGGGASLRLRLEIAALRHIPLDDAVGEGPHAIEKRIMEHSRAGSFAWSASTSRLEQNLSDIEEYTPKVGGDIQTEWLRYTSVLQTDARKARRSMRIKRSAFEQRIYHMHHVSEDAPLGPNSDGDGDGDDGDDGDGDDVAPRSPTSAEGPAASAANGGDIVAVAGGGDLGLAAEAQRNSGVVRMLREFLAASLKVHSYVSVGDPVDVENFHIFQVLGLETRDVLMHTFKTEDARHMLYTAAIQPYTRYAGFGAGVFEGVVDAFIVDDPGEGDVLGMCGDMGTARSSFREWDQVPSDVWGCTAYANPRPLQVNLPLESPKIPVLCLLDAFDNAGFHGTMALVRHVAGGPRIYDNRKPESKRVYFQCVLCQDDLFRKGAADFGSTLSEQFYKLLLRNPSQADPTFTGTRCKELLAIANGVPPRFAALAGAPPPALLPVAVGISGDLGLEDDVLLSDIVALPHAGIAGDSGSDGDAPAELPGLAPIAPPMAAIAGDEAADEPWHPDTILGVKVKVERHFNPDLSIAAEGIRVTCPNPLHGGHSKYRARHVDVATFGPRAATYFIGAWVGCAYSCTADAHKKPPTRAQIREYMDTHDF